MLPRLLLSLHRSLLVGALAVLGFTGPLLSAAPLPLHVQGNRLVDSHGAVVRLRGVNCAGMEWSDTGEGRIARTLEVAVNEWHANLIRLPLSQDRWFGRAPSQSDGGAAYRALVRRLVDFCSAHNAYIILDLHWSNAGEWGKHIGQHKLPDVNSIAFWKDLAPAYAGDPAVLFDLYNEPNHITWAQWYEGGPVTETVRESKETLSYQAVGLPALLEAVRSTGARNVVIAGGTNWAFELGGILERGPLADPRGDGVVYAVHPYPHRYDGLGLETIGQWVARLEPFAARLPMIVTEFGSMEKHWPFPKEWNCSDEKWNREVLRVLEAHRWNWTAWDLHPYAEPALIKGWDYAPTPEFGVWVKQALQKNLE